MVGQELYKLTLTQLLADVASIVLVDALRWALGKLTCSERLQRLVRIEYTLVIFLFLAEPSILYNVTAHVYQIGPAEFKLADNILKLVYGQALIL